MNSSGSIRRSLVVCGCALFAGLGTASFLRGTPAVQANGSVTFRIDWASAGEVEVIGRGPNQTDFPSTSYPLRQVSDRTWEATVEDLPAGVHFYRLRVDGHEIPDPANRRVQAFFNGPWSVLEIEDTAPTPWNPPGEVPYGTLQRRFYPSAVLGHERPVMVYLTHGYTAQSEPLPALYLLHGSHYDETSWVELGRAATILEHLIAEGRARPMVVVMPFGYSNLPVAEAQEPAKDVVAWSRHLAEELIPWVEANFRVVRQREYRAIAGLSMGGAQALRLGLGRPELFDAIGAFSPGARALAQFPAEYAAALASDGDGPSLLWLGCGRGDRHFAAVRELRDKLHAAGLQPEWREYEGRHTWHVWRACFADFAQRLFPATPPSGL